MPEEELGYIVDGWNDVKTVRPPTGVSVLALWENMFHVEDVMFFPASDGSDTLTYRTYDSDWVDEENPTHWMPITIKGLEKIK
jgi:hypothetical protein